MKNFLLVGINAKYIHTNLAIYSMHSFAKKQGFEVNLAEYTINEYTDDIIESIFNKKPEVLMFSCYIWNIQTVEVVVKNIKKILPDTDIFLGGPEVSFNTNKVFEKFPQIKGVVVGEGEETVLDIIKYYASLDSGSDFNNSSEALTNLDINKISGLCTRENIGLVNLRPEMNMDLLPFPYISIPEKKILYYESSRGCPFSCAYCLSSIDKHVRFKSLDKVFEDLNCFIVNEVRQVKFVDRTFNCNEKRTLAIWEYLIKHDNGITNFHFELAGDLLTEDEINLISTMREGLIQLEIGVQSLNNQTLGIVARKTNFEKLSEAVSRIIKVGNVHVHLDLIAGLPKEDYFSFIYSFDETYKLHPSDLQLGFLKVLKGSNIEKMCEEFDINFREEPPYEVLSTRDISYEQLVKLKKVEEVLEIFYNSGQFRLSIEFMEHFFESPFGMYLELSKDFELASKKQSRINRAQVLLSFASKFIDDIGTFSQILLFDLYAREKMKTRPSFAQHSELTKKEQLELVEDVYNFHVERFTVDVFESAKTGKKVPKEQIISFDYRRRDIFGNSKIKLHL